MQTSGERAGENWEAYPQAPHSSLIIRGDIMHRITRWLLAVLFAGFTLPALAQDMVAASPSLVSVAFENDRMRVLLVRYGPHDKIGMHSHTPGCGVNLATGHINNFLPDGSTKEVSYQAGDVFWREQTVHAVENLGDNLITNIEIELKNTAEPGVPVSGQAAPAGLREPLPAQWEPHHKIRYENQYVRILEINLAPGESTTSYHYSGETLTVMLTLARLKQQGPEAEWQQQPEIAAEAVRFDDAAHSSANRRSMNTGPAAVRMIVFEFLR